MTPKVFRETKGWTFPQMAEQLGLEGKNPARTYQRWETGECPPPFGVVAKIEKMSGGRVRASDWPQAQTAKAEAS